jgi:hypothetical protein
MKSSGFPVLSGHAHPFQKIAPFIFFSRGTSYIHHAQSRGRYVPVVVVLYIPESRKNGKKKKGRYFGEC